MVIIFLVFFPLSLAINFVISRTPIADWPLPLRVLTSIAGHDAGDDLRPAAVDHPPHVVVAPPLTCRTSAGSARTRLGVVLNIPAAPAIEGTTHLHSGKVRDLYASRTASTPAGC